MSKNLDDLRRARQAAATALQAAAAALGALDAASAATDAPDYQAAVAAFDAAEAGFNRANAAVKRGEVAEAASASAAIGDQGQGVSTASTHYAAPSNPAEKGVGLGLMVHALARNKGDRDKAAADLDKQGHSGVSAALSGATEAAGGVTVPRAMAAEMIDLLRARVVVRNAGARTYPMPAGQIRHARQSAPATAGYGAENTGAVASEPTYDKIDQSFKKLTGLVPIGNSLLRHSGVQMATAVRDDLVKVMALREDLAFIRGDGSADTPKGIRNWLLAANWGAELDAGVAATAAAAELALRRAVSRVEDANIAMERPGWIMRASAKNFLASLRDANGNLAFPTIDTSGTLLGWDIKTTSQVANNLGTSGDETEIYFGDFAEAMIGDSLDLNIGVSTEAAFVNASGDTISAFQNDLTLMRAISEHDFALAHDAAFSGFNAKGWSL